MTRKGRFRRGAVSSVSFPVRWERKALSCAGWVTKSRSVRAATVPDVMSRTKAKKLFSVDDQIRATAHVECRKDADVIDEIPMAYKDIDAVMAAQSDLVEIMYALRQVVCVKG